MISNYKEGNMQKIASNNIYADINKKRILIMSLSVFALLICIVIDLSVGSSNLAIRDILTIIMKGPNVKELNTLVIWNIRLPMTLTSVFVGGSLGIAGIQVQTLTNNALASPDTLGITASACFGAAIAITIGFSIAGYLWIGTAFLAFIFAIGVSIASFFMGKLKGMSPITLILTGIVMNFFFSALQQFLQYRASPEIAQIISSWTFGNISRSTWVSVCSNAVVLFACTVVLFRFSWKLTAISTGEDRASSLGINIQRLRFSVFFISSILISVAVAFIGTVGFIGLVVPHCTRMILGSDQRYLMPACILFGGILMLVASIIAKLLSVGTILPVGIVTSLIGVPFLFGLLLKRERRL
jgi:iron complex transport system permease protein